MGCFFRLNLLEQIQPYGVLPIDGCHVVFFCGTNKCLQEALPTLPHLYLCMKVRKQSFMNVLTANSQCLSIWEKFSQYFTKLDMDCL